MFNLINRFSCNINFFQNKVLIPLSSLQKKIMVIALSIFSLIIFLAYQFYFRSRVVVSRDKPKEIWWTKITKTLEFDEFKKNWTNLAKTKIAREQEGNKLKDAYQALDQINKKNQFPFHAPVGTVHGMPGQFGMWMPGVALVAAYLCEKKKIQGLYVCESLEALSTQIQKIHSNPADQRYAFVVGTFSSQNHLQPNFPQHKATVCIEKKDGKLTIVLLDPEPIPGFNEKISPKNLNDKLWEGNYNSQELVFRAILSGCREAKCEARLLHSQVEREKIYGCAAFALQDGMSFLRDPDFFNRITCNKDKTVKIDQNFAIEVITALPPEYMIGAQSSQIIDDYKKKGGQFNQVLPGKTKTLQNYLDAYFIEGTESNGMLKKQNHYITNKAFKYLNFVLLSLKNLKPSEIDEIINKTLISAKW